jgi:acetylglutamate/LysW-gamma-L-alpha-aminoadipate kinase
MAIVVKCGGNAGVEVGNVCTDLATVAARGEPIVLVHGGSATIERLGRELEIPMRKQVAPDGVSTRYNDRRTVEVVRLALRGEVGPEIVCRLRRLGIIAIGLGGIDGGLVHARRKPPQRAVVGGRIVVVRDSFAGVIESVDGELVSMLLDRGLLPVLSPPAITACGEVVNVDADRMAAAVAAAVGAHSLVILSETAGLMTAPTGGELIDECVIAPDGKPPACATGGMALKVVAARDALRAGVPRVVVAGSHGKRPLQAALAGSGTQFRLTRPRTADVTR